MKYEGNTGCKKKIKIPVPFKLIQMHEALERILIGLFPITLLMKVARLKEVREENLSLA